MNDRGAASMFAPAFVALGVVLVSAILVAATLFGTRARAQGAADAAALAAAPVTFRPFGATGNATDEAGRFAGLHDARLVTCECHHDPTYATRVVTVEVAIDLDLPLVGAVAVPATARAEFAPAELLAP